MNVRARGNAPLAFLLWVTITHARPLPRY
jgi:hypothetical protein